MRHALLPLAALAAVTGCSDGVARPTGGHSGATCGDGICQAAESCATCAADCNACEPTCADGSCEPGEGCETCPADCGTCDTACVVTEAPAPGTQTWTVQSGGLERSVLVHVPSTYDHARPAPVVLDFHGLGSTAAQQAALSLMDAESDAAGFVAIYPEGTGTTQSWNAGVCCGTAAEQGVDDVGFVRDLLDTARQRLCIDQDRVFATGLSNGGFLSHRLGCELSDRIAAIAPVAGVIGVTTCAPGRAVPVIEFHGTADTLVPYDGQPLLGFPSVMTTATDWATRDGCGATPVQTYAQGDATCQTWGACAAGAEVTLCTIDGGGHTWPGGIPIPFGKTSTDISATDAMWDFFLRHPRVP